MKTYTVTIRFAGLTGEYLSRIEGVRAKNAKSASTKASKCIGNRDGYAVSVVEALS